MEHILFYAAGCTEACLSAARQLADRGLPFTEHPGPEVTDVLLDIPSFRSQGLLRSGEEPQALWNALSPGTRIWGGRLMGLPEALEARDLLEDPGYLARNAAITADCALRFSALLLKTTWQDSHVLILGWGRIGKCLSRMLKTLGAQVTVCARSPSDRALVSALGCRTAAPENVTGDDFEILFNTVPAVLPCHSRLESCPIPIDLASSEGLSGPRVIHARGLPGIYAPVSSGRLIAETVLSRLGGEGK